jgi:hypothetical protein
LARALVLEGSGSVSAFPSVEAVLASLLAATVLVYWLALVSLLVVSKSQLPHDFHLKQVQ